MHLGSSDFREAEAGGKAAPLHLLARAGFPVPPGFVVPSVLALDSLSESELAEAIQAIGGFPVAVRSSGLLEDLGDASFAGQYATFLEVSDLAELRRKIALCRLSGSSPQVQAYLRRRGLAPEAARVSVLVQRMVPASVAGVAFTLHPLNGREEHALVELCRGLGERLVSGLTDPTRITLDLRDASVVERSPGAEDAALSPEVREELRRRLLELQARAGRPQDVEFAVDAEDRLWLLQSRPITVFRWRDEPDEYTNADLKDGGVSARVCTPMMYALYRDAFQEAMPAYAEAVRLLPRSRARVNRDIPWIRSFYGRVYWNASAAKRLMASIPGFDEQRFDQDLGIQKSYGPQGPLRVPTTAATILPAIPVAIALARHYERHLVHTRRFRAEFPAAESLFLHRASEFARVPDADFWAQLQECLNWQHHAEVTYFTTIFANTNAQSDFKTLVAKIDHATGGVTSVIRLMGGLEGVSHLNVQRDLPPLLALARTEGTASEPYRRALAAFLASHHYHANAELDLLCPRWGEDPSIVTAMVERLLRSGAAPADPDASARAQARAFREERDAVRERLREAGWATRLRFLSSFESALARMREYLAAREEMRDCSSRAYRVMRLYLLEAGTRLARSQWVEDSNDVFFMDTAELRECASTTPNLDALRARIGYRRLMFLGLSELSPPNEFGSGVLQQSVESARLVGAGGETLLQGLGCSPGVVEGPVRVLAELSHSGELREGEILVTRFTDPGWTPVLGLVRGIITEVGGLLSHAAVIGREYGIPAVLNLPGATQTLRTGMRVRLDGNSGRVTLLNEADAAPLRPNAIPSGAESSLPL
ncbi:MAG: hypothetical protein IT285_05805 [Bdellovibrionales bacterium]|nr:hypothetical protein [Bdellovibrionales bacterium]